MITFPHSNISVGKSSMRLGCQMTEMSGQINYHIGDELRGELTLYPHMDIDIRQIEGRVEFFLTGDDLDSQEQTINIQLSGPLKLATKSQVNIPFHFPVQFGRINCLTGQPKSYWRLIIIISPKPPRMGNLLDAVKRLGTSYSPVLKRFQIPVVNGPGAYRAKSRELSVSHFRKYDFFWLGIPILLFGIVLILNKFNYLFDIIRYCALTMTLVIIAVLFRRLIGFKDTPMELSPGRDGKLRIRLLDRGDGSWKKAKIGIRVVAESIENYGDLKKVRRKNLHDNCLSLEKIGARKDHLVEAVIPWPTDDFPTSYSNNQQGYTWEVYLLTPGLFGVQEQSWPINVNWEAFRLPDESPTNQAEGSEVEEELELPPLKEAIRLKNSDQA